jgi:NAD(P)-dependent dehydrogenase (short-subunit alcohol dehydrogenase family)
MDLNLRGKRALITGASKGIGAATAESFAEEGCHLRLASRNKAELEKVAERLRTTYGVEVDVHPSDLRKAEDIEALASIASDIDFLVNNAGDIPGGSLDRISEETWRHGWELKVFGYINLTRRIYQHMKARGQGVVVNIIGAAGEKFDFNYIAGTAGNAALMAFTRALGSRSLDDKIRVVGINPGPVQTDRIITLMKTQAKNVLGDESKYTDLLAKLPMGRAAKAREIGDMVAFLASERSGYTTGVVVTIDGGISAKQG